MDLVNAERLEELIREIVRQELADLHHADHQAGRLLTPAEVAQMWSCSERTVTRQLLDGSLPGVRIGRNWRVRVEDAVR